MPVPAGSGMPGSIEGRPRPAWATPGAQQLRAVEVVARAALGHRLSSPACRGRSRSASAARSGASPGRGCCCHLRGGDALQAGLREGGDATACDSPESSRVAPVGHRALASASARFLGRAVVRFAFGRPRVRVGLRGHVARHFPARLGGRGVEPAGEVPAGDVRRVEQLLAGAGARARPRRSCRSAARSRAAGRRCRRPAASRSSGPSRKSGCWRIASTTGRMP